MTTSTLHKTMMLLGVAALALAACGPSDETDFGSMPAEFLNEDGGTAPQTLFGNAPAGFLGTDAGKAKPGDGFVQQMLKTSWSDLNPIGAAHAECNCNGGVTGSAMVSANRTYGGLTNRRPYSGGGTYATGTFGFYLGRFFRALNSAWDNRVNWQNYTGNLDAGFLGDVKRGVGDIKAGFLGTDIVGTKPGWIGSQFSNVTSDSGWSGPGNGN